MLIEKQARSESNKKRARLVDWVWPGPWPGLVWCGGRLLYDGQVPKYTHTHAAAAGAAAGGGMAADGGIFVFLWQNNFEKDFF